MEDQKVLKVFVGDSIRNSIQEMKDCISKDLAEFRSMLLEVLGEKHPTSFEPKNTVMGVELWQFRGENIEAWIVQAEHYFNFYKIEEDQKLNVASFYLDGEALEWYQWLFRNNQLIDWMHFAEKVRIRFKQRKYASLQEVPSVPEYPNRLEVVSSDFCQPDILSPCLAHVTDSPLPQNYDEQSEYPIKIDEHKVFDEMLNSNCPKVFTVALDAPFEILDEDVIGPDGSKSPVVLWASSIDMSERYVTTTSLDCGSCKQEIGFNFFEDMYLAEFFLEPIEDLYLDKFFIKNESSIPISELLSDEMTSKDMALTSYTVNAETLLLLGSSSTFYFIIYANHMTQVWDPGRRWCGAYATTYRTFVQFEILRDMYAYVNTKWLTAAESVILISFATAALTNREVITKDKSHFILVSGQCGVCKTNTTTILKPNFDFFGGLRSIEEQPVEHESLITDVITGGVACAIGNLESAKGTEDDLSVLEVGLRIYINLQKRLVNSPVSLFLTKLCIHIAEKYFSLLSSKTDIFSHHIPKAEKLPVSLQQYSSTMSHASSSKICKYDVFLSFRGEDTRRNFVSHLYNALEQRGIRTFKDDERLETGKSISDELLKAIQEFKFAIVIFSKSYASSRWCLEELAHIVKCKKELEQIVIPVFYDVSPSDVRHQHPPFADSFLQHEEKCKDDKEQVQRWTGAFAVAGKLSGYHLQNFK
ncbi:hypothetical protein H5410_063604 [Solanum commersonii]|uniref:TIR domain-containing protein n=1 Tax=Solanum commersonii TaxID=4109 RepID=A0A9J5WG63_SOLCO|nr:hypothetical protein H5410_063604 [Solanum commersonii]